VPSNLDGVLNRLVAACEAPDDDQVSVAQIQRVIGERSFGPMLLIPALIGLSPIGAIPGVPAVMAAVELFFAWQILFGMKHPWLPPFIARRSIGATKLRRAIERIRPFARWVDTHLLRSRLTWLTRGPFLKVIALICVLVSLITPVIEIVPLAGIVPNAALAAFGLAVTAHDGLWALFAFLSTLGSIYLLIVLL